MSANTPTVSGKQFIKAAKLLGYVVVRTNGDHAIIRRNSPKHTMSVPLHKELDVGLLVHLIKAIEKNNPGCDFKALLFSGRWKPQATAK